MIGTTPKTIGCLWCRFEPDTRSVFLFFSVLVVLIAVAHATTGSSPQSGVMSSHKTHVRVVPMATTPKKHSDVTKTPHPIPSQTSTSGFTDEELQLQDCVSAGCEKENEV
jgi:hypothetical protein